jgi:L-ascorbate metabolism protein UlaG (beta-lactamase superfamily)
MKAASSNGHFAVTPAADANGRFRRGGDGRFVNLDGSGPQPFRNVFKWAVVDQLAGRRRKSPATAPVPAVTPDAELLRKPPGPGQGARLVWLGHASWLVQVAGVSLLLDPVLRDRITPFIRRNGAVPLTAGSLPAIDAQLVSHNHYDHLDLPSLRDVGAPVVAGLGIAPNTRGRPNVTEVGWWDSVDVGGVRVTFVPSQHWCRRGLLDANRALWGGFVIEASGVSIYHSGDTAYFDGFREIGRRFPRLDVALLPIGAYDPAWFMSTQHMGPEESVQAFSDLRARQAIAMHWGTFKLTDEPLDEPPVRFRAAAAARGVTEDVARVVAVGETVNVTAAPAMP